MAPLPWLCRIELPAWLPQWLDDTIESARARIEIRAIEGHYRKQRSGVGVVELDWDDELQVPRWKLADIQTRRAKRAAARWSVAVSQPEIEIDELGYSFIEPGQLDQLRRDTRKAKRDTISWYAQVIVAILGAATGFLALLLEYARHQ